MKVHLLRLVERGLVAKTGQGQYVHRVRTPAPESEEGATHCNPVTQASPVEEESPAVLEEEDDPIPQDIPMMSTPAPADEEPSEETPEAPADTRVSPVTGTVHQHNGHTTDTLSLEHTPQFCPGCGTMTCWLDKGLYYQCAKHTCGRKWIKNGKGNHRHAG